MRRHALAASALLLLAADAALACDEPLVVHLADGLHPELAPPLQRDVAPPGGLWWLALPVVVADDGEVAPASLTFDLVERATGSRRPVAEEDVVAVGPRSLAVRVPRDAGPGVYRLESDSHSLGVLVEDAPAVDPALDPPALGPLAVGTETFLDGDGCNFGPTPRWEREVAVLSADASGPDIDTDELLLDVWVTAPGEALPADDAERPLDAVPLSSLRGVFTVVTLPDTALAFTLSRGGDHDVHARVRDPRSGLVSDVQSATVRIAPAAFAGCGSGSCSAGGEATAVTWLGLGLLGRRLRSRRG